MNSVTKDTPVAGRNGVIIKKPTLRPDGETAVGYRTYEVHQRERVGESTEKIKPIQLISDDYRRNPYPLLETLRENYPCYRDWLGNRYWVTQYNDVTSIFADEANFETRPKTWFYGLDSFGRDLRYELPVLTVEAQRIDTFAEPIAENLVKTLATKGGGDLATGFAARFALDLLCKVLDIPDADTGQFTACYWRMQRGTSWQPELQQDGRQALHELVAYFEPLVEARRAVPGEDMISAMLQLGLPDGPVTAQDVVITLLESDHETLHGTLANLWFLLLTHPDEFAKARSERRLMKLAYLETLRHSAPVLSAKRFARHEVERFGKLLPEGALLMCSAAAANRDPQIFKDPDKFIVDRKDMCQREPRGQYRADGLASGIAFGLGKPSVHPAVPEDRPRSRYAITRDTVVTASQTLLRHVDDLRLASGTQPQLTALTVGEMHTCWKLPVTFNTK
ncbi:MAG: cytochrome P450 [Pseudomonadota bacterium]